MRERKFFSFIIIGLLLMLLAAACSGEQAEEATAEESEDVSEPEEEPEEVEEIAEEEEENEDAAGSTASFDPSFFADVPDPPENLEELVAYPGGIFSGVDYEEQAAEIEMELDTFPELTDPDDEEAIEQYWAKLVSLFAENFPDPGIILEKWEDYDFGDPEVDDPRMQFKENYNVEIILDASGSMANYQGSATRMELAKEAIMDFAGNLPEDAHVGLRVYGHEGTGSGEDKELSCASNELVYDIQPYDEAALKEAMEKFSPAGWTPLAASIELAMEDLQDFDGETNTNIIYIVSDGIETCDGDPVEAAAQLADSDITPIVNVIGFDVDNEGQKQLEAVADAADGTYAHVQNQEELTSEFDRAQSMASKWQLWRADAMNEVRSKDVERMHILRDFRGNWADRRKRERNSFHEAFEYLAAQDMISREVKSQFYDMRDDRIDMIYDYQEEIWDTHYEIKEKDSTEAREYIQQFNDDHD